MIKEPSPKNICTLDWAPIFMCYGLARQIEEIESDSVIALDEFGIGESSLSPLSKTVPDKILKLYVKF